MLRLNWTNLGTVDEGTRYRAKLDELILEIVDYKDTQSYWICKNHKDILLGDKLQLILRNDVYSAGVRNLRKDLALYATLILNGVGLPPHITDPDSVDYNPQNIDPSWGSRKSSNQIHGYVTNSIYFSLKENLYMRLVCVTNANVERIPTLNKGMKIVFKDIESNLHYTLTPEEINQVGLKLLPKVNKNGA